MAERSSLREQGEFAWLRRLLPSLYWPSSLRPQLCIGPGDDAGVLGISRGQALVASTDAMVEGVHFDPAWIGWRDIGYKALAVNLSDLAAMGDVKPLAALVTVAFPGDTPVDNVDNFYKGLEHCAQRWKTGFLGGDTVGSRDGWFVSVTVLGEADPGRLLKRSGARIGDLLVSTGPLGLAAAGLEILMRKERPRAWMRPLLAAFRRPTPGFAAARLLAARRWATSLIDCSDGLEASARLLAEQSGTGMALEIDRIPLAPSLRRWATWRGKEAWTYALRGGEDYRLLFTLPPARWRAVSKALPGAAVVGRVLPAREGCLALRGGRRFPLTGYGFAHFG